MIEINGVKFEPRPGVRYANDYVLVSTDIASGRYRDISSDPERDIYRSLILNDLWFIVSFVMRIPQNICNHSFWTEACREVERGPEDFTLDLWAREHGKSSIITIAETIQYALKNPNSATAFFSYVRPVAKKFLGSIKDIFQQERILHYCFPDVVWENCEKDSPKWSLDDGLRLIRSTTRKEPTLSAWGLTEGMPTGLHFERRIYDDISTEDTAESPEMQEKIKTKFDSSQNIGMDGGHHRVIGTFYGHNDPLVYVQGKQRVDGTPRYFVRFKPATVDGTANGAPVFLSQQRLDDLKLTRTFNCQQLLDPTPSTDRSLNPDFLSPIERRMIPLGVYRFMLVDQAGDLASAKTTTGVDSWAVGVVSVEPFVDEIGQSRVFLEDLWVSPASESEAIEQIVRMYLRAGMIMRLGVEKVSLSTTHVHVADALRMRGRYIEFGESNGGMNGVLLRPSGRSKKKFIESSLCWPLNNGKIFYSTSIPANYISRLKMEMDNFPRWHDDALNMLAYTYDMLKDYHFGLAEDEAAERRTRDYAAKQQRRSWMSA